MSQQPNLLLIMVDQMKATGSSLYWSGGCPTPNLNRLAERGAFYEHAFTPHPLCVPARVSLWRSQYPHTHGARRNETLMPDDGRHAFRLWHEAGYRCGLIGKNHCFESEEDRGLFETWCEISHGGIPAGASARGMPWVRPLESIRYAHSVRRRMDWTNPKVATAVTDFPLEDYSTGLIAAQVEQYLEDVGSDPFALWVSFPDPHEPYETPRRYADLVPAESVTLPPWDEESFRATAPERNRVLHAMLGIPEEQIADLVQAVRVYHANIRFIDDAVGRILAALDERGLRNDTLVLFCSDHGDFAGEHRMMVKGGVFYDCLTRVPLFLSMPGTIPEGIRPPGMANLVDIVPTILALQGHEIPAWMQGRRLPGAADGDPAEVAFSEYGAGGRRFTASDLAEAEKPYGYRTIIQSLKWREAAGRRKMVRTAELKYVHDPMGDIDELYDLTADPWELRNLAGDPAYGDKLCEMTRRLADFSVQTEDPHPVPLPESAWIR